MNKEDVTTIMVIYDTGLNFVKTGYEVSDLGLLLTFLNHGNQFSGSWFLPKVWSD